MTTWLLMIAFGLGGIVGLIPSVRLQKRMRRRLERLRILEEYFAVAPYATRDTNVIVGVRCAGCHKTYSVDMGLDYVTFVCPFCGRVDSDFGDVY